MLGHQTPFWLPRMMGEEDKSEKLIIRTTPKIYNQMHSLREDEGRSLHDVMVDLLDNSDKTDFTDITI